MNCVNHPDTPVSAYCQNCGKPLCQSCVRSIGGVIYCEPCLAARLQNPGVPPPPGAAPGAPYGSPSGPVYMGLPPASGPNPGLALWLGFIPGVGAMYNGQFVKGLVHVFVFAILCSFSDHNSFFGILIPFWIAYQVFDAYQTARARRDGTPLPNPFGLNDLGYRLGLQPHPETPYVAPMPPPAGSPGVPPVPPAGFQAQPDAPPSYPGPSAGVPYSPPTTPYQPVGDPSVPPYQGFAPGFVPPPTPPGPAPLGAMPSYPPAPAQAHVPVGAIVLIVLGAVFLLGSFGLFHDEWIGRSWPLIVLGVGIWLIVRRTRETGTLGRKDSL